MNCPCMKNEPQNSMLSDRVFHNINIHVLQLAPMNFKCTEPVFFPFYFGTLRNISLTYIAASDWRRGCQTIY